MLAWLYLAAAIATEVVGTVFLRFTDGFTRPAPSILVVLTYAGSLWAPTRLTPVMAEQATQGRASAGHVAAHEVEQELRPA